MQRRQFRQPPRSLSKIGARYWFAVSQRLRMRHRARRNGPRSPQPRYTVLLVAPFHGSVVDASPRSKLPMSLHIAARAINGLESWFALATRPRHEKIVAEALNGRPAAPIARDRINAWARMQASVPEAPLAPRVIAVPVFGYEIALR